MHKLVYIRWLDSAITLEWSPLDKEECGLTEIETVGYLILEDERHIQVAQSNYEDAKYSGIQSIPQSVILEKRTLVSTR